MRLWERPRARATATASARYQPDHSPIAPAPDAPRLSLRTTERPSLAKRRDMQYRSLAQPGSRCHDCLASVVRPRPRRKHMGGLDDFEYHRATNLDDAWVNFEPDLPLRLPPLGGVNPFYVNRPGDPIVRLIRGLSGRFLQPPNIRRSCSSCSAKCPGGSPGWGKRNVPLMTTTSSSRPLGSRPML